MKHTLKKILQAIQGISVIAILTSAVLIVGSADQHESMRTVIDQVALGTGICIGSGIIYVLCNLYVKKGTNEF